MRTDRAEQGRSTISQDNDRLLHMLKEAEDARSTIEQARAETEQKNLTIVGEVSSACLWLWCSCLEGGGWGGSICGGVKQIEGLGVVMPRR